jgi:chemotaxis signal transduction protein
LLVDQVVRAIPDDRTSPLPLPRLVGPRASAWFEGLLPLPEQSCLLLSPAAVDPRCNGAAANGSSPIHEDGSAPATRTRGAMVDTVVLFSSPALPRCAAARIALPARRVAAIVQALPAIPAPGAAPFVSALGWWRDTVVPIVDFTGSSRGTDAARRYLIARCGARFDGALVAFPVGPDIALHRATAEDRQTAAASASGGCTRGLFRVGAGDAALLDLDAVIAAPEPRNVTASGSI